jgi:hypothetical protein
VNNHPTIIEAKAIREKLVAKKAGGDLSEDQMRGITDAISNLGICITMVELQDEKRHMEVLLPQYLDRAKKLL